MAGHIITVIGGKGGVGKSQLALNLSLAWAMESRNKTLLLDFDRIACGDLTLLSGLKPKKNLSDLASYSGQLDPRSVSTFLTSHKDGMSFIGMPGDPSVANAIDPEALGKSLKAFKNLFQLTVIDAGHELNELVFKALEFSSMILLVTSSDLLALNQTRRMHSDLITMMYPKEMICVGLNFFQKGHPVNADMVGKQLGKPVLGIIPRDDQNLTMSMTRSMPLISVNKSAPFSQGCFDLVRKISGRNLLKKLESLNKPSSAQQTAKKGETKSSGKAGKDPWSDLKSRIHRSLVEEMDLKKYDSKDEQSIVLLKEKTKKKVIDLISKENTKGILNNREDMNRIVKEIIDEALGLGPLEDLLRDKTISEIMVVGPKKIYFEKNGKNKRSEITFTNDRQVLNVIERIVAPIGRRIDEKTPYVDARLADGSRVHAIIPPCALDGGTITIRKFPENRLTYKDLVKFGSMTQNMADFLRISVEAHRNMVVSGGTGSGKTTLINVLGSFIPSNERIITCEDSAELDLPQEHVVRLETKPPSLEGEGAVDIRLLVKQTLRMKPDRIIIGECRGGEALDMLQAMNTGHDGSLTTVHSNSPRDCMSRLETLVQYAGTGISPRAIKEMVSSAVHLVVQQTRLDDGSRRVMNITEVGGMQGDVITLQDIFVFKQEGVNKEGKIIGKYMATGFIPKFIENLEKKGYRVPRGLFRNE